MALLTDAERRAAQAAFNDACWAERTSHPISKADLVAAFNAIDAFFDGNVAAINNAFPEPAKSSLTVRQKALIVAHVIRKRYGA